MKKIKSSKKKVNFQKLISNKPEHLKNIQYFAVRRRIEIIPIYDAKQLNEWLERCQKKREEADAYYQTFQTPTVAIAEVSGKQRFTDKLYWNYFSLGLKLREFMKAPHPDLAVDIIKKYPAIVWDDGVDTALALFVSMQSIEDKLEINPFWGNPIREEYLMWLNVMYHGNPRQRKEALNKLKKAGLNFLIAPKSKSRPKTSMMQIVSNKSADLYAYSNRLLEHLNTLRDIQKIRNLYESILKDIQEIVEDKQNKSKAMTKYVKEKNLVERIGAFLGKYPPSKKISILDWFKTNKDASPETTTNKVVETLLNYYKKPSEIALVTTGAILGIGTRNLKEIISNPFGMAIRHNP